MKIKQGDTVKVTVGKDRGKTGKVEKVYPKKNRVLVAEVNKYKKHVKPQGQNKPGGIIDITKPLPVANVALVCPQCKEVSKIGYMIDKKGEKHRVCKKCKQVV